MAANAIISVNVRTYVHKLRTIKRSTFIARDQTRCYSCLKSVDTSKLYPKLSKSSFRTMAKFMQFVSPSGCPHIGIQVKSNGGIIDLNALNAKYPTTMVEFLASGHGDCIETIKKELGNAPELALEDVKLLAPITKPDKVLCVGLNYKGHCAEQNVEPPKVPMIFSKFSSCIVGPFDNIEHPKVSTQVDWEVELAVVILKKCKHVSKEEAMDYVFGYTVAQDISARDWQREQNGGQFLLSKSMDTFCPLGPCITHKSEIPEPHGLAIKSWVNNDLKQSGNTNELVHRINEIISRLSSVMTLLPGDIILTGTPAGVGVHRSPPQFLKPGDILESEIQCIGKIRNTVV